MTDDKKAFDKRLVKNAEIYGQLYPSIGPRLRAAFESGNPLAMQVARAMGLALDRAEGAREQRLRDGHGLTPQEVRIVLHLVDGGTVASAAVALDVAESTVRTHLKSVFAKTGVTRQAQLANLLRV